jgi:predicted transcriptional regulator
VGVAARRREPGVLERELLAVVGAADRPLTPAEALAALGGDLAYTTVMTTLARLHDKGALTRSPAGRAYAYALAATPDRLDAAVTARRMGRILDADPNRSEALTRFVADLRPEDGALLAHLLASHQTEVPEPRRSGGDPAGSGPGSRR